MCAQRKFQVSIDARRAESARSLSRSTVRPILYQPADWRRVWSLLLLICPERRTSASTPECTSTSSDSLKERRCIQEICAGPSGSHHPKAFQELLKVHKY